MTDTSLNVTHAYHYCPHHHPIRLELHPSGSDVSTLNVLKIHINGILYTASATLHVAS